NTYLGLETGVTPNLATVAILAVGLLASPRPGAGGVTGANLNIAQTSVTASNVAASAIAFTLPVIYLAALPSTPDPHGAAWPWLVGLATAGGASLAILVILYLTTYASAGAPATPSRTSEAYALFDLIRQVTASPRMLLAWPVLLACVSGLLAG